MKKLIFIVLIMTCSLSQAGWIFYGSDGQGRDFFYEDQSIKRSGEFTKVWLMWSGRPDTHDNKIYHSKKMLIAFDCANELSKFLAIYSFSAEMGAGEVVFNYTYSDNSWSPIVPNSLVQTPWKISCQRK